MRIYGVEGNMDWGSSVAQTPDSGYVLAGYTRSSGPGAQDVWLVRTDAAGDTMWTRTWGGADDDWAGSVALTADGGYIITGTTYSFSGTRDLWLIRADAEGDTMWTRLHGGVRSDGGHSVVATGDGGFAIAGHTGSDSANLSNFWLVRTDAAGDTMWTRAWGGSGYDYGESVDQTSDGGFIITGRTESFGAGGFDAWLVRTDAAGDTLWTRTYGGTGYDYGEAVAQTSDGGYIVAGRTESFGTGHQAGWLIKTDASGDSTWSRTYGGQGSDGFYSVAQTPDGGYVVTGWTTSYGAGSVDAWLVRTDVSGDTLWTRTWGGPDDDRGSSVALTRDGGYVITGYTEYLTSLGDAWLIKTDSQGMVGVAEPGQPAPVEPVGATVMPAARLLAELAEHPDLLVFDASGRRLPEPADVRTGVVFLRSGATTRRVLVMD